MLNEDWGQPLNERLLAAKNDCEKNLLTLKESLKRTEESRANALNPNAPEASQEEDEEEEEPPKPKQAPKPRRVLNRVPESSEEEDEEEEDEEPPRKIPKQTKKA